MSRSEADTDRICQWTTEHDLTRSLIKIGDASFPLTLPPLFLSRCNEIHTHPPLLATLQGALWASEDFNAIQIELCELGAGVIGLCDAIDAGDHTWLL